MLAKNKSGWIVHEYLDISEGDIGKYKNVTGSYAIIRIKDKYLIGYNNWRDQWEFPAGGIDAGETARQAAFRELFEETHQEVNDLEFKGLFRVTDSHGTEKYQAVYVGKLDELAPYVYSDSDEMTKIRLWNMKEDIGYVDECDVAIAKTVFCKR